jgi:hypothetical protein
VRELTRRLRALLAVVTFIGSAEAAIGLLLVLDLHLQRELGLEPLAIAGVSLPGGIALAPAGVVTPSVR